VGSEVVQNDRNQRAVPRDSMRAVNEALGRSGMLALVPLRVSRAEAFGSTHNACQACLQLGMVSQVTDA
jgi:hypothetical protein